MRVCLAILVLCLTAKTAFGEATEFTKNESPTTGVFSSAIMRQAQSVEGDLEMGKDLATQLELVQLDPPVSVRAASIRFDEIQNELVAAVRVENVQLPDDHKCYLHLMLLMDDGRHWARRKRRISTHFDEDRRPGATAHLSDLAHDITMRFKWPSVEKIPHFRLSLQALQRSDNDHVIEGPFSLEERIEFEMTGGTQKNSEVVRLGSIVVHQFEDTDELYAEIGSDTGHGSVTGKWRILLEILDVNGERLSSAQRIWGDGHGLANVGFPLGRSLIAKRADRFRLSLQQAPKGVMNSLEAPLIPSIWNRVWLRESRWNIPSFSIRGAEFEVHENGKAQVTLHVSGEPTKEETKWRVRVELQDNNRRVHSQVETVHKFDRLKRTGRLLSSHHRRREKIHLFLHPMETGAKVERYRISLEHVEGDRTGKKSQQMPGAQRLGAASTG